MKLLTKAIENKFAKAPLYSTDGKPAVEKECIVKFFTPDANWTWYAVEGEKNPEGDWEFFGLVDGHVAEWGYFTLSQLQEVRGQFRLPVERDRHYSQDEWQRDVKRLGV